MTRILMIAALTLGSLCLAGGWFMAGSWPMGLAMLLLIPISLFLVKRKFGASLGLLLTISVFSAALGLWARVQPDLALTGVLCALASWDLDDFSRRLAFASEDDNPKGLERGHLAQVSLVLLAGVGITLFSQASRLALSFEWVLLLALLAFFGTGALVNGMKSEDG